MPTDDRIEKGFCPTCGQATTFDGRDKSGHTFYGRWLSFRDFEQILLSLGASGSDVRRFWPEVAACPCGCGHDLADREGQLRDHAHSELVFQGKPPLPDFVPGVGHVEHGRSLRSRGHDGHGGRALGYGADRTSADDSAQPSG